MRPHYLSGCATDRGDTCSSRSFSYLQQQNDLFHVLVSIIWVTSRSVTLVRKLGITLECVPYSLHPIFHELLLILSQKYFLNWTFLYFYFLYNPHHVSKLLQQLFIILHSKIPSLLQFGARYLSKKS